MELNSIQGLTAGSAATPLDRAIDNTSLDHPVTTHMHYYCWKFKFTCRCIVKILASFSGLAHTFIETTNHYGAIWW